MIKTVCDICGKRILDKDTILMYLYDSYYNFCSLEHLIQFAVSEQNKLNLPKQMLFGKKKRGK